MSSTSDFSELRKSILEKDLFSRGSLSVAKKRPYFPKKEIPLAPLDFNKIKQEIEEAANNDIPLISIEHDRKTDLPDKASNPPNTASALELSNSFKKESTKETKLDLNNRHRKENIEPDVTVRKKTADNDSFDMDFSVLSLYTPVKGSAPVTPKRSNLDNTKHVSFNNFVTPNVNNILPPKIHCSVPRKTTFTSSSKLINKPEVQVKNNTNNVVCSIPRSLPDDKTFQKLEVNGVEYIILNLLGTGGSSHVYQCFCMEQKRLVAIKCVSLENTASAQGYINEVQLLKRLHGCDRVIKLYDHQLFESDKKLLMVLERGGKDFTTILKNLASQTVNIPLYMLLFYWMEMLQAVKQIHSHGVIHADLKPSNFLWEDDGLKLIDFGIASSVQNDMTSVIKTLPEGSCNYMSPEAFNNEITSPGKAGYKLHYKSDVWSLGCILYQLVYKRTPFHHVTQLWKKVAFITDPNHRIDYPEVNWLPPKIIDTIKSCLQYNVKSRPSINDLIEEYNKNLYSI